MSTTEISKRISTFGRYAAKRPPGLVVQDGFMRLGDIMTFWGRGNNLSEQDVLNAIHRHMFHNDEEEEQGPLRFGVTQENNGDILVQVLPKRKR